ncbi:glycosyltransferase [Chloroflexi bacterium TSY]|nr:glycosyltransferase [Chloroflexi bacterium TSY]
MSKPDFSIIIPIYNDVDLIENCLSALSQQTVELDRYEIIVVDDGSTDGTTERIVRWANEHPETQLTLSRQENAGPASARNHGVSLSRGEILLFTDSDCVPESHWIESISACIYQDLNKYGQNSLDKALMPPLPLLESVYAEDLVVGCKGTYATHQTRLVALFVQAEYEERYARMSGLPQIDFIDTYSAAYRRDVFCQNKGFDTQLQIAEDQEFSFRLASQGYRLLFVPNARVYHHHPDTIAKYWHRKFWTGYWKARLVRLHPDRIINDSHTPQLLKIQMMLWLGIISLFPFALSSIMWSWLNGIWLLILGLFAIFCITTISFLRKLTRHSIKLKLIAPALLAVRAIALGLGFAFGMGYFTLWISTN